MYYYLYHSDLQQPKFSKLVMEIETKLHKLGLEGQTTKLGRYASLDERVKEINFTNQDTLVVVGDDSQLIQVINLISTDRSKPTIGYIPISEETNLTKNLGLPSSGKAVMELAKRRIENLDLGLCNENFFIESICINNPDITIKLANKFTVSVPSDVNEVLVLNLEDTGLKYKFNSVNPHDGQLDIFFIKHVKNIFNKTQRMIHSIFKANKIIINSLHEPIDAKVDQDTKIKTPLEIGMLKKGIKIIVGKQRLTGGSN